MYPTYFRTTGLALEPPLVRVLRGNGLTGRHDPVIVQSFETANLRALSRQIDVKLAQLLDASGRPYDFVVAGDPRTYADLATPVGLAWIARYADGNRSQQEPAVPAVDRDPRRPPGRARRARVDAAGREPVHPAAVPDR